MAQKTKLVVRPSARASALGLYLTEIGRVPLLTGEQEQILARRIQEQDDRVARQQMLRANLRLVVNMAKRYVPDNDPEMLLDLIQDGNVGLLKAVDRFKPGRQTRFSTYGVYWIRQAILRALKNRRVVRLPENVVDAVLKMQRTRQQLYQVLGRQPTSEELGRELKISPVELGRLEEAATDVVSLDQLVRGRTDDDEAQLQDLLEDVEAPVPGEDTQRELVRGMVASAVQTLPRRERQIIEMRYGLGEEVPSTLEDIGHRFGISRERVRQLQNVALKRLKARQSIERAHR